MKVLIVGAGFGGLALAAYLERDGHAVTVVERKKDRKQMGFVIGLWSNGMHTLEPVGVVERIRNISGLKLWTYMAPLGKEKLVEPNDLFGEAEYVGTFPTKGERIGVLFLATVPAGEPDVPE